jgi:acetyl esterase
MSARSLTLPQVLRQLLGSLAVGIVAAIALAGNFARAEDHPAGDVYVYKTVDGRGLRLWVITPPASFAEVAPTTGSDKGARHSRPAIVFFHGGGWTGGGPDAFNDEGLYLASRGMVAVQVEYRLLEPNSTTPPTVCIEDAKSAMRWVRAHASDFAIDPERIAASGGSSGGHLAAFLGLVNGLDDPQDNLLISAKPNVLILYNPVFDNGPGGYGHERVGNDYLKYSPYHHVSSAAPPTLVLSGESDVLIPAATVRAFQSAMQKAGVRCDVILYPGEGHGFFHRGHCYYDTLQATEKFLTSLGWLSGPSTLQTPVLTGAAASCQK